MPEIQEVLPKYLQIAGHLRDQIVRGDRPAGSEVPSERELAATWNVARPTASKALDVLRQQGYVESRVGSGTYVRDQSVVPRARERYDRAKQLGTMYGETESVEFLRARIVPGPAHVTTALSIAAGSDVVERKRLLSNSDIGPTELSTSWFPAAVADRAPRLLEMERIRGGTGPYVAEMTGRRESYARDQVCARAGVRDECQLLGIPDGFPVLQYWLTVFDDKDAPIQFDEALYPPERWAVRQEYRL